MRLGLAALVLVLASGRARADIGVIPSPHKDDWAAPADPPPADDPDSRAEQPYDVMALLVQHHLHDFANEWWNAYGQVTWIEQPKLPFHAAYTNVGQPAGGQGNSLLPTFENSYSVVATLIGGVKLWRDAEVYFAPEVISEQTLSRLTGLGGAIQNFEMQKGGTPSPTLYVARAYLQQTIPLGGERDVAASGPLLLAKKQPRRRIVVSLGRFTVLDFFDKNSYTSDGSKGLINMGFMTYAAYDFTADERGYTFGGVAELYFDDWELRFGRTAPPKLPNRDDLDTSFGIINYNTSPGGETYGDQVELVHNHVIAGHHGAVRVLGYEDVAYMGKFDDAIVAYESDPTQFSAAQCDPTSFANSISRNPTAPDLCWARKINSKYGLGVDVEQDVASGVGVFARAMVSDGQSEVDAYLPADSSFAAGVFVRGQRWCRRDDLAALGFAISGISPEHVNYLKLGGIDGFIGDGELLHPASEAVGEAMYSAHVTRSLWLSGDYQLIVNPAYNADRGPVHVLGGRFHAEF
jgi:high affinity Mn2+ porin